MEELDLNYRIINNFENQINMNLPELTLNNDDLIDKKIEDIINYCNNNIIAQFNNSVKEDVSQAIIKYKTNSGNFITDVDCEFILKPKLNTQIAPHIVSLIDLNKDLLVLATEVEGIFFFS